jgi:predicted RNA-binding Zn ribbon-like protein
MDALCLDILHSDWHDYRGSGPDEDRLLQSGWLEHVLARWELNASGLINEKNIAEMQALRTLMERIVQSLLTKHEPKEADLAALNIYLNAAPSKLQIMNGYKKYQLEQIPLHNDWSWVLGQVAISFAELLTQHDTTRIKQCENPDCRWIYYDESANQTRRWCEDSCANLMRVRKHRTKHREGGAITSTREE